MILSFLLCAQLAWSHSGLTTLTNEEIVAELKWTEKYIFDHTGYKIKYFRPPYGMFFFSFLFRIPVFSPL